MYRLTLSFLFFVLLLIFVPYYEHNAISLISYFTLIYLTRTAIIYDARTKKINISVYVTVLI